MRRRTFLLGAATAAAAGTAGYYRSRVVETTPDVRYPGTVSYTHLTLPTTR